MFSSFSLSKSSSLFYLVVIIVHLLVGSNYFTLATICLFSTSNYSLLKLQNFYSTEKLSLQFLTKIFNRNNGNEDIESFSIGCSSIRTI